jgi:transcriptional regulator with XRE-family HTH domain
MVPAKAVNNCLHFQWKYFIITVMNEASLKSMLPEIGKSLRLFREKLTKNQGDIAQKAGISTSMLSQIERGTVSPSIDTLAGVCMALELDMADLFRRISPGMPLKIHHDGTRLYTQNNGIRFEQLSRSADISHPAEMLLLEIEPGKEAGMSDKGHEGVEMGYVLEGNATLVINGIDYKISEGDSVSYNSNLPHKLINTYRTTFKAVWNALPPHRDYLEEL